MEEIYLITSDNKKIAVNYSNTGKDTVLINVHGWFMTKDSMPFLQMGEIFSEKYDVLTIDCRGHGRSKGFYTFTAKEAFDISAAVEFAKTKYKKIYLMGFSLGGALVLIYAAMKKDIDKIISVSSPMCFEKIENQVWHPNAFIPTLKKFELKRWLSIRPSFIPYKKIRPIDIIDKINVPVLFIAGGKDVTVKKWHTEKLFEKAICKKKYVLFKNCIHAEDIFIEEKENFMRACFDWLENN